MPTKLQLRSGRENWDLYMLEGMKRIAQSSFKNVDSETQKILVSVISSAIMEIKRKQRERNPKLK